VSNIGEVDPISDALAAVRRLLEVEEVDAERLAIRAGWPAGRVVTILAGEVAPTDDEVAHLLACFGLNAQLRPLDDTFLGERERAADLSYAERAEWAFNLISFTTSAWNTARAVTDG
jgi:hypothetical protein